MCTKLGQLLLGNQTELVLHRILKTAPEVKQCLVKKMLKYYWGDSVGIDQGYLEQLSGEFIEESKKNSSHAFLKTLKKVVLSNSFTKKFPEKNECYDFSDIRRDPNSPPCAVSHILEKNCFQCHRSESQYPYLNLSKWKENDFGEKSFVHLKPSGGSYKALETWKKIRTRISTNDLSRLMPLGRHMDAVEREQLFLWINEKIEGKQ